MRPLWVSTLDEKNLIPLHRADRIFIDEYPNGTRLRVQFGSTTYILWEAKGEGSLKNIKENLEAFASDLNEEEE